MSEKLNWGVLGNSTIGRVCVIPAIQKSRNGFVRALATRSPDQAAELVQQYNIDRVYDHYAGLIEDPAIEAVYIPLPNHLHHEWTIKALNAGKHVLCEKPLACNAHQAEEMAAASRSANRLLMEAFMYRFHPRSRQIRQLVQEGTIGQPRIIRAAFCYRMSDRDYQNPQNARLSSGMGGGALLDVGCYCVGVARWIYNAEPHQVQCQAYYHPGGVDLHVTGMMRFGNRQLATFEASFVAGLQQTYTVVGDEGVIQLPHDAFIPWENDAVFELRGRDAETGAFKVVPGVDEYRLMVEHFADGIQNKTALACTLDESIGNMRVLDALAEAAQSKMAVNLTVPKRADQIFG